MELESIRIDQLHLRVPGLTRDEAHQLGADVARHLADGLHMAGGPRHLGALSVRISLPEGTPKEMLAWRIAEQILSRLR